MNEKTKNQNLAIGIGNGFKMASQSKCVQWIFKWHEISARTAPPTHTPKKRNIMVKYRIEFTSLYLNWTWWNITLFVHANLIRIVNLRQLNSPKTQNTPNDIELRHIDIQLSISSQALCQFQACCSYYICTRCAQLCIRKIWVEKKKISTTLRI